MITLLIAAAFIFVFGNIFWLILRLSWGLIKVVGLLILIPLCVVAAVTFGILYAAFFVIAVMVAASIIKAIFL